MPRLPKKQSNGTSGGARLKAKGRKPVTLGLEPADYDLLRAAAQTERRPLTQFLIVHGLAAAEKTLRNMTTHS